MERVIKKLTEKILRKKNNLKKALEVDKWPDFDGALYLCQNPDVAQANIDPLEHYIKYGKSEGRQYPSKEIFEKSSADYERVLRSGYFDPEWYLDKNVDIKDGHLSPLEHFLQYGVWEGRDPGPRFSTTRYWEQYPDIKGTNPLLHYINHGIKEGRIPAPPMGALAVAAEVYASIRDLDPALDANERFSFFKGVPFLDGRQRFIKSKQILRYLMLDTPAQCSHFIFVPWLVLGGAERVTVNICRAAEKIVGADRIAIVVVDYDKVETAAWLPEKVHIINFAALTQTLSFAEKGDVLEKYIQAVRPFKILNNNSNLTWDLFRGRGIVIRQLTDMYACMFCRDYNKMGRAAGYADTHLRESYLSLKSIYLDNEVFSQELIEQYGFLPTYEDKFIVLKQPINIDLSMRRSKRASSSSVLKVLWASRLVRQKNYKLLAQIINQSPKGIEFTIWGEGDPSAVEEFQSLLTSASVEVKGAYKSFESLPLEEYDAYLYTSLWDGIPNAVLEAAAFGFPLICSNVGGIGEVVNEQRGWLIEANAAASEYISALREVAADKDRAWERGDALRSFVIKNHSLENLVSILRRPGQFLENVHVV